MVLFLVLGDDWIMNGSGGTFSGVFTITTIFPIDSSSARLMGKRTLLKNTACAETKCVARLVTESERKTCVKNAKHVLM